MPDNDNNLFNKESRTKNAVKSSLVGSIGNIINILLGFIYRSIFLHILSAEYLGLNGLFTNVLQVLSLAEMGITTAITFKFYEPISKNDVVKIGKLMNFFKKVYLLIATFITVVGLAILPFLNWFIKDSREIPADINIYYIYILFLFNTVSSYLFVYKQTLLSADQKNYIVSLINLVLSLIKYAVQIFILFLTKNYSLTLSIGIVITILVNYCFSIWVTRIYKPVFQIKETLEKKQEREILNDTKACMIHKFGATVKTSTDSIVLSKMVSLFATGIYSNYSLLILSIQNFLSQLLGSFVSSIGNANIKLSDDENYKVYKKLLFINLWIAVVVTSCVFLLIDDFICIWVGSRYSFDKLTVTMLCLQFYVFVSRLIDISYINGCGLFVKDRIRPLIEAILNLGLSIVGVKLWGIVGVFIGTVVSSILTVWWREPLILFRYRFKKSVSEYWKTYILFSCLMFITCFLISFLKKKINFDVNLGFFIVESIIIFLIINVILYVIFRKKEEFCEFKIMIRKKIRIKK